MDERTASDKGLLRPYEAVKYIDLRRYAVEGSLSTYVERCWSVAWDLPEGASYESVVVPHPCVNLSFMPDIGVEVHGPGTAVSRHPLSGSGRVFGVKFRPGGWVAFTGSSAHLADWTVGAGTVLGTEVETLGVALGAGPEAVAAVSEFLAGRLPAHRDPQYERLLQIVAVMLHDRRITRVDQVASRFGTSLKSLQRLFGTYIGLGPKWLIRRYRVHDATDRLSADPTVDLAGLAAELGWSDQAHFTNDFKNLIGSPPAEYASACASTGRELVMASR